MRVLVLFLLLMSHSFCFVQVQQEIELNGHISIISNRESQLYRLNNYEVNGILIDLKDDIRNHHPTYGYQFDYKRLFLEGKVGVGIGVNVINYSFIRDSIQKYSEGAYHYGQRAVSYADFSISLNGNYCFWEKNQHRFLMYASISSLNFLNSTNIVNQAYLEEDSGITSLNNSTRESKFLFKPKNWGIQFGIAYDYSIFQHLSVRPSLSFNHFSRPYYTFYGLDVGLSVVARF